MGKRNDVLKIEQLHKIKLTQVASRREFKETPNSFLIANETITHLNLSKNGFKNIRGLEGLSQLIELNLSDNRISKIEGLTELVSLTGLDLRNNNIETICGLERVVSLERLALTNNRISKIEGLDCLIQLRHLYLGNNKISKIEGFDNTINLYELYLNDNRIEKIEGLNRLIGLHFLNLKTNRITRIDGLGELLNLEEIILDDNCITEINGLNNQSNLKKLNLQRNQISETTTLDVLIGYDEILDIWLQYNPFLSNTDLGENPSWADVRHYLRRKNHGVIIPAKVMLLGNSQSGKTSFLNYLTERSHKACSKGSTHILDVRPYYKRENGHRIPDALIYDFGGQDYYHGLYQAFFSAKSVNFLFWHIETDCNTESIDSDGQKIRHYSRAYWLHHLQYALTRAKKEKENRLSKIPVFVVQTHADKDKCRYDSFKDDIPHLDIRQEFYLSLEDESIQTRDDFQKGLQYLKAVLDQVIETELADLNSEDFLRYVLGQNSGKGMKIECFLEKYRETSSNQGSDDDLKEDLKELARRGVVLYCEPEDGSCPYVWPNPVEAVKEIHGILGKQSVKSGGMIPKSDFEKLVPNELRNMLIQEKVIFYKRFPPEGYLIPSYLKLWGDVFSIPDFTLKFKQFIPFGFINQLIYKYGDVEDQGVLASEIWRDYISFTYDNYVIRFKLDFSGLTMQIKIEGDGNTHILSKEQLQEKTLYNITKLYFGESVEDEAVHFPDDMYLSLDQGNSYIYPTELIAAVENSLKETPKYDKQLHRDNTVAIDKFKHFVRKLNNPNMKNIFISFSTKDQEYMDEFLAYTKGMQDDRLISKPFSCSYIALSDVWRDEIKRALDNCDIMICLISVDFMNSDYCRRIEVRTAMQQNKKLIPIIVRACDWETSDFGQYQASLGGKCVTLRDQKTIAECSPNERAAVWTKIIKQLREAVTAQ